MAWIDQRMPLSTEGSARAALAGMAAAGVWAAAEPTAQRLFGTSYSDVRLIGAPVSRRHWRLAGTVAHLANGAVAGVAFHRLGLRGWKAGVVAAELESLSLWPAMAIVDRVHPDRRSGAWPPLLGNGRVFAQEVVMHALFGAVLGSLLRRSARSGCDHNRRESIRPGTCRAPRAGGARRSAW